MKLLYTLLTLLTLVSCTPAGNLVSTAPAEDVIASFAGEFPANVELKLDPDMKKDGCDSYSYRVRRGVLEIEASSQTALCRGFYDYVTSQGYGVMTWSGTRCDLPDKFPNCRRHTITSPFSHHLFYNVCTNGYSTAYWTWDEWSREIDWLALHGFDMPLAPIAGEAIFARVWRDMGLSREEIDEYFTGPGHMPWMRMGNMTGLDGAPSQEWHQAQIELQHKIIEKMKSLDMKPVYQGFAGFVPKAMKTHYPEINLTTTKWGSFENYMLSPLDSLFTEIQKRYIAAWEEEFGKGEYYLIDSFNELDIPFGEQGSPERAELLRKYSSTIYTSLTAANPDAVWVMQGWMFGYQRNIWDPQSVEALLSGVPDDKMLIIDLAVDFNRFIWQNQKSWEYIPGMFGKQWIYSTTPNFGGRTAIIGNMESFMNGHIEALECENRGNLTGYGASPEGIEQNEAIYEIIADAGWRGEKADLQEFLRRYSTARYGSCPDGVASFWNDIVKGPYGHCTNNARYLWQLRPVNSRVPTMGIDETYFKAIESFLSCAEELGENELYRNDAIAYAAMYLAAKADIVLEKINWGYVSGAWNGNGKELESLENEFVELLENCDRLLESHPIFRLERWQEMAQKAGQTDAERDGFTEELRRLVTVWGGKTLSDYSCRLWSGVIRDYYIQRWTRYFETRRQMEKGSKEFFDYMSHEEWFHQARGLSPAEPFEEPLAKACELVAKASGSSVTNPYNQENAFGYICRYDFTKPMIWKTISVHDYDIKAAGAIEMKHLHGKDTIFVRQINLSAHTTKLGTIEVNKNVLPGESLEISLDEINFDCEIAQEVNVQFVVRADTAADASMTMKFIKR